MTNYDLAPGLPTDCVFARAIRAHIIHTQLAASFVDTSREAELTRRARRAQQNSRGCALLLVQAG